MLLGRTGHAQWNRVFYCQYVDLLLILIAAARSGIAAHRAASGAPAAMFFRRFGRALSGLTLHAFYDAVAKRLYCAVQEGCFFHDVRSFKPFLFSIEVRRNHNEKQARKGDR